MKTLVIVIPILLFACNSNTGKTKTEPNDLITAEDIKADSKVAMEISGMTCEMGCVSTIRNHVTQMKGTTNFEMDFDTERATDFATIEFDSRLLSKDDIKEEIESIAQGIYSVVDTKELSLEETNTEIEPNSEH